MKLLYWTDLCIFVAFGATPGIFHLTNPRAYGSL